MDWGTNAAELSNLRETLKCHVAVRFVCRSSIGNLFLKTVYLFFDLMRLQSQYTELLEDGASGAVNYHFLYDTLVGAPTPSMRISDFPMYPFTNNLLPSSLYNLTFMKCPNCAHPSAHWTFHNPHNLL